MPATHYLVVRLDQAECSEAHPERFVLPTRERPSVIHTNQDEARKEARRLAERHNGVAFGVFALTSYAITAPAAAKKSVGYDPFCRCRYCGGVR